MTPLAWHHWAKMMIGHNNDYSGHDDLVVGSPTWKPRMVSRSWACRKYRRICWKTTTGKFFPLQSMVTPISRYLSVCLCERKIIIEHWLSWWLDFFIFVAAVTWPGTWAPHPPFIEKNLHTRRWILSKSWFLSIIVHHCCLGGAKYIPGVINNVFNTRKNLDLAARIWKQNIGWQQYYFASINRLKEHVCLHIYRALPKIGNKCQCLI